MGGGVSIYVLAWILFGIGAIAVAGMAFSLTQDRDRPRGRHSSDDRVKPEDFPEEWQRLRIIAFDTLVFSMLIMSEATKDSSPLRVSERVFALTGAITLLIWEIGSWRKFTDPGDRRRALNSARWFFVPVVFQMLFVFHVWHSGLARIVALTAMTLIVAGPDVESWIRRRLQRRAGGTTT